MSADAKSNLMINRNKMEDIDYCLVNSSDLASAVNCKKDSVSEVFSKYKNINFKHISFNDMTFDELKNKYTIVSQFHIEERNPLNLPFSIKLLSSNKFSFFLLKFSHAPYLIYHIL